MPISFRTTPDLDQQAEERLITVLSQLIEQKFKTLTYKELSKMLRLTPLRETESFKEAIKDEHVAILTTLVQSKFALSDEMMQAITVDLQNLSLEDLRALIEQILKLESFEQLEIWIADHLPKVEA